MAVLQTKSKRTMGDRKVHHALLGLLFTAAESNLCNPEQINIVILSLFLAFNG